MDKYGIFKLIPLLLAGSLMSACSSTPVQSTDNHVAMTSDADKPQCSNEVVTGSLVEKKKICTSSDEDRNSVEQTMQDLNRPGNSRVGH